MKIAKLEELSEERDRRSRESNIIIHGVKENVENVATDSPTEPTDDKVFVNKFLPALEETGKQPSFTGRIGKKEAGKVRPIKIAFKSESDKRAIFKKLRMLKRSYTDKGSNLKYKCGRTKQKIGTTTKQEISFGECAAVLKLERCA